MENIHAHFFVYDASAWPPSLYDLKCLSIIVFKAFNSFESKTRIVICLPMPYLCDSYITKLFIVQRSAECTYYKSHSITYTYTNTYIYIHKASQTATYSNYFPSTFARKRTRTCSDPFVCISFDLLIKFSQDARISWTFWGNKNSRCVLRFPVRCRCLVAAWRFFVLYQFSVVFL